MIEPVASEHILLAGVTGAMVVLFGAAYALFFALGRLQNRAPFRWLAWASYAGLAVSTAGLARALNLGGYWSVLVVVMLTGYLLAPHAIWWLCVGTHGAGALHTRRTTDG